MRRIEPRVAASRNHSCLLEQLIAIVLNIVPDVSIMLIVPLWLQAVDDKSPTMCAQSHLLR